MKLSTKIGLVSAAAAIALAATSAQADRVRWKLHSAWGSAVPHLGTSGVRFSKTVNDMTGGEMQLKFFEPGALIPAN